MARDEDKVIRTLRRFLKTVRRIARTSAPAQVHHLRTRSRRLEAAIRATLPEEYPDARRLLKAAARLRKKAGRVRDLDVLARFTSQLAVPGHDAALAQLTAHLIKKRQQAARKLRKAASSKKKETARKLKKCRKLLEKNGNPDTRRGKIESAAATLQAELAAWPRIDPTNLHDYRIKLKELRYTLELLTGTDVELISGLVEVTEAIGEWHDWSELHSIATELFQGRGERDLLSAIRSTVSGKFHNALLLATALEKQYFSKAAAH